MIAHVRVHKRAGTSAVETQDPPCGYYTDGVNLYRVARWLERPVEPRLAEIEDCRSLDRVLVSGEELARLALRPVAPHLGGGPAAARETATDRVA